MLSNKFGVNWLLVQEKKWKLYFHGGHLGFPIGTILAVLDLQVIPMLPIKFRINWLLGFGEEVKNRFLRWPPWRPSLIPDWNDFSYFWSSSHLPSFQSIGLSVQEKKRKLDFQDDGHGDHLGYQSERFYYFWSTSPWCFLLSFESVGFWV